MKFGNPLRWWRELPRKTRIRIVTACLLVLLGTEAVFLAPWAFEMAFLVDLLGTGVLEVLFFGTLALWLGNIRDAARFVRERAMVLVRSIRSAFARLALPSDTAAVLGVLLYRMERRARTVMAWCTVFGLFASAVMILIKKTVI